MQINLGAMDTGRILVIDDEPENTILLERILTQFGFQSVICLNDPR